MTWNPSPLSALRWFAWAKASSAVVFHLFFFCYAGHTDQSVWSMVEAIYSSRQLPISAVTGRYVCLCVCGWVCLLVKSHSELTLARRCAHDCIEQLCNEFICAAFLLEFYHGNLYFVIFFAAAIYLFACYRLVYVLVCLFMCFISTGIDERSLCKGAA